MFVAISDSILAQVAAILASQGFILQAGCDVRSAIVACAEASFPRTDGNHHRFPKGYQLKSVFYPAFHAAEGAIVEPAKAAKGKGRKTAPKAAKGARFVKGSPEAKAYMASIRAKRNGGTAQAPAKAAKAASGKLSQAQMTAIAEAAAKAAVNAILAAI